MLTVAQQQVQLTGTTPRPWSATFASPDALADAAARLRTGSRRWYWRIDDIAAFTATALWTYLTLPLLLTEPDVRTEIRPPSHAHPDWDRIDLEFPRRITTHCHRQTIHVDQDGRIRRHDYTATAFGQWAHAAQLLDSYKSFDGLLVATHRRVHPRLPAGHIATWPTLVSIDIHHVTAAQHQAILGGRRDYSPATGGFRRQTVAGGQRRYRMNVLLPRPCPLRTGVSVVLDDGVEH
jgi:hypothetical protein